MSVARGRPVQANAWHCGGSRRERMHVYAYARAMKTRLGRRALNLASSALQSRGDDLVGLGLEWPSYL